MVSNVNGINIVGHAVGVKSLSELKKNTYVSFCGTEKPDSFEKQSDNKESTIKSNEGMFGLLEKLQKLNEEMKSKVFQNEQEKKDSERTQKINSALVMQKETLKAKELTEDLKEMAENFRKTPEGIRRANMSNEQIIQEAQILFNNAFDELGIPKEQRPGLEIAFDFKSSALGGGYIPFEHTILYNTQTYKDGFMEMEDIIMHEATHCKEALIRASIPKNLAQEIIRNELILKIINGETGKIPVREGKLFGTQFMNIPQMTESMRNDFSEFMIENFYNTSEKTKDLVSNLNRYIGIKKDIEIYNNSNFQWYCDGEPIKDSDLDEKKKSCEKELIKLEKQLAPTLEKLQTIVDNNSEFVHQYKNNDEAINALIDYSIAHQNRYNTYIECYNMLGGYNNKPKAKVGNLSEENLAHAEQSLRNYISGMEGSAAALSIDSDENVINQYQFGDEEVLAQKNGNEFLIKNNKEKLETMSANGTLSPEYEKYLTQAIERAQLTIEYKTKGLEYRKKYCEMLANPGNNQLKTEVKIMEEELEQLDKAIKAKSSEMGLKQDEEKQKEREAKRAEFKKIYREELLKDLNSN